MNEKFFSKKYQVKREIARGGMGTIYLATDTKLGREVAIKMLHPQYSGELGFAQRFLREARAMAKLDHLNIIRIWSVEEEEHSHCIVMEYFPGNDLKQIIRSRGPLPISEALSLTTQIIQGLAYAHYMGIIHRDIKPANILVDQAGKAKITDFGIAAAFSESSLTVDGTVMGTPEYMAPEQARAEHVGSHSDLYSVGILLYELLTGQTPYKGIPAQSLVAKLAFGSENPVFTFSPTIPGELIDLITKMTQKRVEDRLTDINEILSVLKTEFPSSPIENQDDNTTEVYHSNDPSEGSTGPSDKTFVPDRSISLEDKTGNLPDIPSDLPPLNDDSESRNDRHPLSSPQTRKLLISSIGILALIGIIVLVLSQWPPKDLPSSPPNGTVHQSDIREKVETTIGNIKQITQDIQTTQEKINRDFDSLSSAIHSLHGEIIKKKIPSKYSDAQDWLDKTKKEIAALVLNKGEIEKSQQLLLNNSKKAFTSSMQQGEQLLQQDLFQAQQKQLSKAKTNLENAQHSLETTFSSHLQNTQNLLSKLETRFKNSEQTILSREKSPSGESTPPKAAPKNSTQIVSLKTEILSIDQEIENLLKSFEASTQNFTSQLSNVQAEVKQIQMAIASDPNSTQKLDGLKDRVGTIQEKAQSVFSQQKAQQQKLTKMLQTAAHNYQGFSQKILDSSQKAEFGKLSEILKRNENRLEAFPPDSWNTLQSLSLEIDALIMASKNMIAQNIQEQHGQAEQIGDLSKKALTLKASIQEFLSETFKQYQNLSKKVANDSSQIDALEVHKKTGKLEQTVSNLQDSLGTLTKTITQYSDQHDQQFQTLSRHQREIHNDLFVFTEAPLPLSLKEQVSRVLHTLKSNQRELEDLKQLPWKELKANLDRTLLAFDQAKESIKQEKASKTPSNQPATNEVQLANTVEALTRILNDFRIAYENRDLLHLKLTTKMSESRTRNLDLMFKTYTTIDTHTEIVSTSESQAKAKIFIDKLINKEGENITPNFIIRETTITIPKKNGKWGKIQW